MRLNLSLLEGATANTVRIGGAELWRGGMVQRIVRLDPQAHRYQVSVGADRDSAELVQLGVEVGAEGTVLDGWDCTCADGESSCVHAVAAGLALQHMLESVAEGARGDPRGNWRDLFAELPQKAAAQGRATWICYDLSLHTTQSGEIVVGVVRRKRSAADRAKRTVGAVCGWAPTAVGHFGYKTKDDPAETRDDLIPVLCSVNRHDLRVRTIQPGFVDTFLRLFVDAEPLTLRVDGEEARVDGAIRHVSVHVIDTVGGGIELRANVQAHGASRSAAEFVVLPGPVPWLYLRGENCFVRPDTSSRAILALLQRGAVVVPAGEIPAFCRDVLPTLRSEVTLVERTHALPQARIANCVPVVRLAETDEALVVSLLFHYRGDDHDRSAAAAAHDTIEFAAGQGPKVFARGHHDAEPLLWLRDLVTEHRWTTRLQRAIGGALPGSLPLDEALDFLVDHLPSLERDGAEIAGHEALVRIRPSRHSVVPQVKINSGIDWFGVHIGLQAGEGRLSLADVIAAWRSGARYVRLTNGEMARLPAAWLRRHAAALTDLHELAQRDAENDDLRVEPFLAATLLRLADEHGAGDAGWHEFADRLASFEGIGHYDLPAGFQGELRGYQRRGYDWLCTLRDLRLHCCLADDMGLGKTVQALAVLLAEKESGRARHPSLVVAPTSVVQNWADEAARFVPGLRTVVLRGGLREDRLEKLKNLQAYELVVTSYALLRLDIELLERCEFHYAVLDEAQAIKNAGSQTAQAARTLKARHRLTLTGTPLENNLMELWSQFTFLMPGFFGSRARFLRRYGVEKAGELQPELLDQLRFRLRPFLLRRLKSDVLTELPPVTEVTLRCTMGPPQRTLYEKVRNTYRAQVLQAVDQTGIERNALTVLEALLRLRQACCHPDLLPFDEARSVRESAKMRLFLETVADLLAQRRRVLVFSQWTSMLRILRRGLGDMGVDTAYMDGSTRDRSAVVAQAQADDGPPVFLVSLKAGGVGLNLTAADVVIHYDPWWNPAVEQQASDRVHRIGQTRPVLVVRLAVEDSVEDQILQLQHRKRYLATSAIEADGQGIKTLTRGDLEAIFGGGSGSTLRAGAVLTGDIGDEGE
ncbi:MAG: SNF2 helicase associated domain-containing protein [Deltaproteobacteria bacterium]|nr:SNF2 helicase associated domain-containing protein [Deltaproteobacteria bacterium]